MLARWRLGVLLVLSIPIGIYAYLFQFQLTGDPAFHARFSLTPIPAFLHVIAGGTLLALGGAQFSKRLRASYPKVHRIIGRTYLIGVLLAGCAGFVLAFTAEGGLVSQFGFATLAIVWLWTGTQAFIAIRASEIAVHQAWMMRNYALAFAAVTLRIQLGLFEAFTDAPFESFYPVTAWFSWVPNLLIVEWFLIPALVFKPRPAT